MEKTVLISSEIHNRLKVASKESGIKIKNLTESAIIDYLKKIKKDNKNAN